MGVTSSSTLSEVKAQWDDNVGYFTEASIAKAKLFIEAGLILLNRQAQYMNKGAASVSYNIEEVQKAVAFAQEWLLARDESLRPYKSVTRADFRGFRGYGGGNAIGRGRW